MAMPRTGDRVIVKIGGSLTADRGRLREILSSLTTASARIVIVTGGGPYADAVREVQGRLGISDRLAHRQALAAMNLFAEAICELEPALVMATSRNEVDAAHAAGRIPIFLTDRIQTGGGGLPESWALTSDSYAAFLAFELDAVGLVLVKSADAPASASTGELARDGLVDAAFPSLAARLSCPIRIIGPATVDQLPDLVGLPRSKLGSIVTNA
ncbi:hypothetical protein [Chthonobacter albigriseus]|uniref:amino acid kinase family protein n=1 Tax=Chthonobacter albigriseus TaxID=1683161 RepID=UPI0015EE64AC|nr:hypothetical protein [Chthonobacter albigriseus]